jgi:FAD:protein FMN transferase
MSEVRDSFRCFGATCAVIVEGPGPAGGSAADAIAAARRSLLGWHQRFSRFSATSELSRLNADPRPEVPVSGLMGRLVEAVVEAGERTGGLVDGTLLHDIEAAGYLGDLRRPLPLELALGLAPRRRPAGPSPRAGWRQLTYDRAAGVVRRPPGVAIDSGGLAKGLCADVLGGALDRHAAFAVDCAGDLLLGGVAGRPRPVQVESPFGGRVLHTFERAAGGVATSGIGRRSWLGARGRPAHHLLDPATGRPAFTGLVQVTALAPTALEAEIRAKASILSGPDDARGWLPDGGVLVGEDGGFEVIRTGEVEPRTPAGAPARATATAPPARAAARPSRARPDRPSAPSAGRAPAAAGARPR